MPRASRRASRRKSLPANRPKSRTNGRRSNGRRTNGRRSNGRRSTSSRTYRGGEQVAWISIDPIYGKVVPYERPIAQRIENQYRLWNNATSEEKDQLSEIGGLGAFNATVHFQKNGRHYQTTPGRSLGRNGFKTPGYRSVSREPVESNQVTIHMKQNIGNEWRRSGERDARQSYTLDLQEYTVVAGVEAVAPRAWVGDDLESSDLETPVIVWQWCYGVPERQGNLMSLSDEWWIPYPQVANAAIEQAYDMNKPLSLTLPDGRVVDIVFEYRSDNFAFQRGGGKERLIRRTVTSVSRLRQMFERRDASSDSIDGMPAHFFCPITQDVMVQPVTTSDGHTYESWAIRNWFKTSNRSPLTNLPLDNRNLTPNDKLLAEIQAFVSNNS
jgi:hypothetical protein